MQEEKEIKPDELLELIKGQKQDFIVHVILREGDVNEKERNIST